ncbi:MAG: helix-turn-helix domain-containing protein [Candidatus Gastranaerophilales bacterium]|nr:helix-turn-helix domain-containing protein [Candidatus Gastranaerophilales bacterium]MCM1072255.1 helix-turn-helix domain-containing protein [Bacteroides sp.]
MNTAKKHAQHGFTQFDLSKKVLNNLSQYNLKPTAKLVLLYLCDCYNPKHGEMFPKQSTIANKLGISEVSVIRAIQELHKEGLLISERKYTNKYKFTSRIAQEQPKKTIDDNNQKDSSESIKKIAPIKKQKKETKKEQTYQGLGGNVYSTEEYRVLKDYVVQMGGRDINAYIARMRQNGTDKSVLKKHRQQVFITKRAETNIIETQQLIAEQQKLSETAVKPCYSEAWKQFGEKIKRK